LNSWLLLRGIQDLISLLVQHRLSQYHSRFPASAIPWRCDYRTKNPFLCALECHDDVLRANKHTNVGGHIASFASAATLYDVGYNHFWHAPSDQNDGDLIFTQGHLTR